MLLYFAGKLRKVSMPTADDSHSRLEKSSCTFMIPVGHSLGDGVVCGVPVRELAEPRVPLSTGICQEPRVPILTCYERWRKPAVGQGKLHCETSESLVEFLLVFTIILHSHQWRR